jgi:Fic family protein
LNGIIEVSNQATETARRILDLRESHRLTITDHLGRAAGNGHKVLEYLYKRPIISVNDIVKLTGTSYPAANKLVERMVENDILREITGQSRNRRFRYDAYINLFSDM